jgi:hypothetical protein
MLDKLIFLVKDFWYPGLGYVLGTSYLLLAIDYFRKRVILVNVLLLLLLVWQIGYVFEFYFRYIYDQTDSFNNLLTSQRWEKRHIEDRNQLVGVDQFRDTKDFKQAKQPGEIKIGVVGDSIAYGIGIENPEDRFSNLLETKLKAAGLPAKVYNLSRPGNDLPQSKANFDKIFTQGDFDLIIWQLFPNDVPAPLSAQAAKIKSLLHDSDTNPLLKDLLDRSYAFNFFYFRLWGMLGDWRPQHLNYQLQAFNQDEIWLPAKQEIIGMINAAQVNKIKLVAVLFTLTWSATITRMSPTKSSRQFLTTSRRYLLIC